MVNILQGEIEEQECRVVGYVVNLMVIVRGPIVGTSWESNREAFDKWCAKTGLSVNTRKTEVIVFTRRYKNNRDCSLSLNAKKRQRSECKYLGVKLDSTLS